MGMDGSHGSREPGQKSCEPARARSEKLRAGGEPARERYEPCEPAQIFKSQEKTA